MNTDNMKEPDAMSASLPSEEPMTNEKEETVPGQQIGLYSEADSKEVCQVVDILNPDKNSMESRG